MSEYEEIVKAFDLLGSVDHRQVGKAHIWTFTPKGAALIKSAELQIIFNIQTEHVNACGKCDSFQDLRDTLRDFLATLEAL